MTVRDLYEKLSARIPEELSELFCESEYPWEIVPHIGEYLKEHIKKEGLCEIFPDVFVSADVKIAKSAEIQGPTVILSGAELHIDKFAFICLPLMLTLAIPLFMIKEGEKYGYPENQGLQEEKITIKESIYLTFKNKVFLRWLLVNCCTFFGMQMFLVSMNTLIMGGMKMNGFEMAILNTFAFAPVPIMLYLINKLKAKKGIRFTYQTCLAAFSIAILSFFFASTFVLGENNKMLQYVIGCAGGVVASWAIGAFFMVPYHITAQISSVEEKLTHKNHSAMYFAGNALFTSIVSAISGSLVYENIKNY